MIQLSQDSLLRLASDLLYDHLKASRDTGAQHLPPPETWTGDTHITPAASSASTLSLEADSLEFVSLASTVMRFFQLQDSGLEDYLLRYRRLDEWCQLVARARAQGIQALGFASSGSTGPAKTCIHNWQDLVQEIDFFASLLEGLPQFELKRVVTLVPSHHIYGFLFGLLLPEHQQVPACRGLSAIGMAQARRLQAGDLLVGHPFLWRELSQQGSSFPEGVVGLTSTAPCDPAVIARLKDQGLSQMLEIYGSSETAGVGYRFSTHEPFELLPRWDKGPSGESLVDRFKGRELSLEDRVRWQDSRHLTPTGRLDRAVQVGGVNVYPQAIARKLEALASVAQAQVRLGCGEQAERLKAFIVPTNPEQPNSELEAELTEWCRSQLSAPETPTRFSFGRQLPSGNLGKAADWTTS